MRENGKSEAGSRTFAFEGRKDRKREREMVKTIDRKDMEEKLVAFLSTCDVPKVLIKRLPRMKARGSKLSTTCQFCGSQTCQVKCLSCLKIVPNKGGDRQTLNQR